MSDVTRLLEAIQNGEPKAADDLLPLVYAELRQLARARMSREHSGGTLQPTALVHEAWLRVGGQHYNSRGHFFGAAAEAMRRILIDRARRRAAVRHGAGLDRCDIEDFEIAAPARSDDAEMLAVHDALDRLAAYDARKAELVKLRYFAGLTLEEAADVLGVSVPTAKRDWQFSRAWLAREIRQ